MTFEEFKAKYQKVPVEEYPNNVLQAMPEPVVSVLVSTYQHAPFIRECLDGILMQETDFPFEILIGEDESNDGTREICIEYAKRHPEKIRLLLHHRKNNILIHGKPTSKFQCRYTGFMARGKYLALCDGDDYWIHNEKLKMQYQVMENNSGLSLCGGVAEIMGQQEGGGYKVYGRISPKRMKPEYTMTDVLIKHFIQNSTFFFRKKDFIFPEWTLQVMNTDVAILAILGDNKNVGFIHEVVSIYRVHKENMWTGMNAEKMAGMQRETYLAVDRHFFGKYKKLMQKVILANDWMYYENLTKRKKFRAGINVLRDSMKVISQTAQFVLIIKWLVFSYYYFIPYYNALTMRIALRSRIRFSLNQISKIKNYLVIYFKLI